MKVLLVINSHLAHVVILDKKGELIFKSDSAVSDTVDLLPYCKKVSADLDGISYSKPYVVYEVSADSAPAKKSEEPKHSDSKDSSAHVEKLPAKKPAEKPAKKAAKKAK